MVWIWYEKARKGTAQQTPESVNSLSFLRVQAKDAWPRGCWSQIVTRCTKTAKDSSAKKGPPWLEAHHKQRAIVWSGSRERAKWKQVQLRYFNETIV